MNAQDRTRFATAIHGTFEIYSPKPVSDLLMNIWWSALKPYGIDDVCNALTKHISDPERGQYQPKPADVLRFLTASASEKLENLQGQAEMQWMNVTRAIQRTGAYKTPTFKDPITAAVVTGLGGWVFICSKTERDLEFLRRQFASMYVEFERRPVDQLPHHIAGLEDVQKHKATQTNQLANLEKGLAEFRKKSA
jgi:hypothetical protein